MTSVPAKSEQAEYAVFELLPCANPRHTRCRSDYHPLDSCTTCMAECGIYGQRVDLSSGVKVESMLVDDAFRAAAMSDTTPDVWVAVPSMEETTNG